MTCNDAPMNPLQTIAPAGPNRTARSSRVVSGRKTSRQILRDTWRNDGVARKDGSMIRRNTMSLHIRAGDALMRHFADRRAAGQIKHSPV